MWEMNRALCCVSLPTTLAFRFVFLLSALAALPFVLTFGLFFLLSMDDEKKIDPTYHQENSPPSLHEDALETHREGFSFRRLFHNPDHTAFYQEALDKYGEDGSIDPEVERKLVRTLDWTVIPILGVSSFVASRFFRRSHRIANYFPFT